MPAAAVKGIIVSLSIITALGLAVIENPQIQAWLEEQRQRIAELLRSIGQELDPQSRRAAEAFAFEGRTPVNDAGLRREVSGSQDAAAVATGRSMSNAGTIRRIPIKGPSDPDEAEERWRKGIEYLARRHQKVYEMQQKRKEEAKDDGVETPTTPTSFDAMVDDDGKLRLVDNEIKSLPDPPTSVPVPERFQAEMAEVERNLTQPMLIDESSSSAAAWQSGSRVANPFDDEYAMDMDRSATPKPPVPPKIALEELPPQPVLNEDFAGGLPQTPRMPGSFTPKVETSRQRLAQATASSGRPDMTYEEQEQLAIALSLSEAERRASEDAERRRSQTEEEDAALRAAILASLRDQQSSSAPAPSQAAPLIDITESQTAPPSQRSPSRGHWETLFDQDYSPAHEPLSAVPRSIDSEEEDELYSVTPQLTRARLASLDAQNPNISASPTPYDPVREAAASYLQPAMDESFYSAASPARSQTLEPNTPTPQLIDTTIPPPSSPPTLEAQTPSTHPAFSTDTDSSASSDTFASISTHSPLSRTQISAAPSTRHEDSDVEVLDITNGDDSDVDMLSEVEGDGIRTPDSWTEVGSRDGDSQMSDDEEFMGGRRTWAEV